MSTKPAPTPSVTRATPAPIITISADALAEAFDDNEIAAEATYGGANRITVVGRIKSIGVEIMGHPYVVIEAGNTLTGIQCVFSKTAAETLAKYSKGLRVAITGQMRFGAVLGHLMRDCTIAPIVKKAIRVEKAIAVTN